MTDIVTIGECMVELSRGADGFALAYGGDTFNTAAYASRLGLAAAYGTALGDDPYSDAILALAAAEGVATDAVPRLAGRVPGLYVIETDERGERRFFYWRGEAPARELFERPEAAELVKTMAGARCVYFSGITLSLYSPAGLDAFEAALRSARTAGATITFDGNYRPRGWKHDAERAQTIFGRFLPLVDIALPTHDDEVLLWGDQNESETIDRLSAAGVGEIALKQGGAGAVLWQRGGEGRRVAVPETVAPVDTTAAGDSFNAGYLAARLAGETPEAAALLGHRLAAVVIRHRGAIVPRQATDAVRRGPGGTAATGR